MGMFMSTRDEYVRKMHSLLDKGNAEIEALESRLEHVEAGARATNQKADRRAAYPAG